MKSYLRRMLVVMSINCVVNLCSCVDFVIGFPVWLWIHLEKNADYADAAFARLSAVLMA